jgi:hypothetical protein
MRSIRVKVQRGREEVGVVCDESTGVMDATEAGESTPETPNQAAAKTLVRHRGPTDPSTSLEFEVERLHALRASLTTL